MDSRKAVELARKILEEERTSPTVHYMLREPVAFAGAPIAAVLAQKGLQARLIWEKPGSHRFSSQNYDLLAGIYTELNAADQAIFIQALSSRIVDGKAYRSSNGEVRGAGSWRNIQSELPLVAEFLIRQKQTAVLLAELKQAPIRPPLTILLVQLAEIIALDFALLSDSEYEILSRTVKGFQPAIHALSQEGRIGDTTESNTRYHLVRELPSICESIVEMSRKATFLRMKSDRTSETNVELRDDKQQVSTFLEKLKFSRVLLASLEEVERSYREATTVFEYKECIGHLRSFLENLHKEACVLVNAKRGGILPTSWGRAVIYLVQEGVLTKSEEAFVTSLYTLTSDTGVHPLVAEREYARLMRNMNIEYGLLFLTRMDKWHSLP